MQNLSQWMQTQEFPPLVLYVLAGIILAGLILNMAFLFRGGFRHARQLHAAPPSDLGPWTWRQGLLIALLLVTLHTILLLSAAVARDLRVLPDDSLMDIATVAHTLFFHAAGLLLIALLLRDARRSWQEAFGLTRRGIWKNAAYGVTFYLAAMPVMVLAAWIYEAFLHDVGYPLDPRDTQDVVRIFTQAGSPLWLRIYMGVVAVTLAPLTEELLFRGVALPLLARYIRTGPAILLLSLTFAILHHHVPSVVPLFVISVAFSYAYVYSRTLVVPVVMHVVFNAVGIACAILKDKLPAAGLFF